MSIGEPNLAHKWKCRYDLPTTVDIVLTKAFAKILEHGEITKNGSNFALIYSNKFDIYGGLKKTV